MGTPHNLAPRRVPPSTSVDATKNACREHLIHTGKLC